MLNTWPRKIGALIVVAFLINWLFKDPIGLADAIDRVWETLKDAYDSITTLFDRLLNNKNDKNILGK